VGFFPIHAFGNTIHHIIADCWHQSVLRRREQIGGELHLNLIPDP
jgi:hypothetical protein